MVVSTQNAAKMKLRNGQLCMGGRRRCNTDSGSDNKHFKDKYQSKEEEDDEF